MKTWVLAFLAGAALSMRLSLPLSAQALDHAVASTGRPTCLDSIPASAFRRVAVYATVHFTGSVSRELHASAEILLQDVATRVQTLLSTAPNVLPAAEPAVTWRGLSEPLRVTVYRDGRITHRIASQRGDTAAAALLARALDLATPEAAPFVWGADSLRDSVSFRFELDWPMTDRSGKVTPPHFTSTALLLFSVAHPWEVQAAPKPNNKGPLYPNAARSAGYEALVNMQFLIDTSGRAVPTSMRALWPDSVPPLTGEKRRHYDSFVESVLKALSNMAFFAAEIGGCKTAQLVQMPFQFSLSR